MPSQAEPRPVHQIPAVELVDHHRQVGSQVVLVVVVHRALVPDDGRVRLHHRVSQAGQIVHGARSEVLEGVDVEGPQAFVVVLLVRVLPGVEPEHGGELGSRLVPGRQGDSHPELEAVGALHLEALPGGIREVRRVILVLSELGEATAFHEVALGHLCA